MFTAPFAVRDEPWPDLPDEFVEIDEMWFLRPEAQACLNPPEPTVTDRIVAVRRQLAALAAELPAAARRMVAHELLDAVEEMQAAANLLGACDQAVVAELDRQGVHETAGATSTANLLLQRLRVRPAEAKRRVFAARTCSERVGLDGQILEPECPRVAAAQANGQLTPDHAATIARALTWLPVGLDVMTVDEVERSLVELAGTRHASDVAAAGRYARDVFDPDGPEPRDARQRRRRELVLSQADDGAGVLRGATTAELLVKLQAVLSPLAKPRPADEHGDDTRSYGQRLHDALEELCDRVLRSGTLPDSGGVPATVAVTITLQQLEERTGRVSTHHGGDLTVQQLLDLACEAEVIPVVLNDAGGILAYGRTRRFATPAQTKALAARDHGCTFPGCSRPPEWCQRHHVEEWVKHRGPTDTDQLALLCGYHHSHFEQWGWTVTMQDGVPWWKPPAHLDPQQQLVQNTAHHVLRLDPARTEPPNPLLR